MKLILWPLWKIVFWIANRKSMYWFSAPHPYWDCKNGCAQTWSTKRYGERPQRVFYKKWERRRQAAARRLGIEVPTLEEDERKLVRLKYGMEPRS